eukprot:m.53414 g.53414  ORF g.53414 m.53414 type:complete len:103 (+) comp34247_c0_seq2:1040-1348(+)
MSGFMRFDSFTVGIDVHSKLSQRQALRLAKVLGRNWASLAVTLGFHQGEIDNFEYMGHSDLKEQAYKMLIAWLQKLGHQATWRKLAKALKENDLLYLSNNVQ